FVDRPGQEADLVEGAEARRPPTYRLLEFHRSKREVREARGEVFAPLLDVIGRSIMKQVPDDLQPGALGRFQRRKPARPVVLTRRLFDQMPAKPVADRPEAEVTALAVILDDMAVVARRPDQVEANAIAPPV